MLSISRFPVSLFQKLFCKNFFDFSFSDLQTQTATPPQHHHFFDSSALVYTGAMIPKLAIERAIEGGWNCVIVKDEPLELRRRDSTHVSHSGAVLDPTFWQALGKALGWEALSVSSSRKPDWHYYAQVFYDRILTGGDTEAFWAELLSVR